jgi:hypothetical protein
MNVGGRHGITVVHKLRRSIKLEALLLVRIV